MPAVLRIIEGPQSGASREVRQGQRVVLGRGERTDFHVLDSWASREHCSVTYQPDGIILEDLRSKNGTYVSGHRVERTRIPDGSLIQIGTTTIQVLMRPTEGALAAVPAGAPRRGLRKFLYAGVALLLLAGLAFGGLAILGGGPRDPRASGGGLAGVTRWLAANVSALLRRGPARVAIAITSEPSEATVYIDDEPQGVTPLDSVAIAPGEHALRVQKVGYEVHRGVLAVAGRKADPLHVVLTLSARGALAINSKPDGASVYLDGEYRGKTPLRLDDLDPHAYGLRLELRNFADWHQQVTVKPTDTVTVDAALGHREISYYLNELKTDPNNVSYHTEVAHLYLLEQKVDSCIEHLTRAFEITIAGQDTTRPEPYTARLVWLMSKIYVNDYFRYGDERFVQGVRERIEAMLIDLAAKHPGNSLIQETAQRLSKQAGMRDILNAVRMREAEAKGGDQDALLRNLEAAIKAAPDDYRTYLRLGRIYLLKKQQGVAGAREKAIEALNAALQRCPNEAAKEEVRRLLGLATR